VSSTRRLLTVATAVLVTLAVLACLATAGLGLAWWRGASSPGVAVALRATSAARGVAPRTPTAAAAPPRATLAPAGPTATLRPAVDWPELPDVQARPPITTTAHFVVHALDPTDATLTGMARAWSPYLEDILVYVSVRLGRSLPKTPVHVVFAPGYAAACPARGLAAPGEAVPLLMVYVDGTTSTRQVRAVLAHEMVHHLTNDGRFVGDAILTEGVAHWGAGTMALEWQDFRSWDDAVRLYLDQRQYVSVTDDTALNPRPGDDCLERRDRVYNIRTAFVDWLVRTYGLETVLAMDYQERTVRDAETGRDAVVRVPDYEAATGHGLAELERAWLATLARREAGDA